MIQVDKRGIVFRLKDDVFSSGKTAYVSFGSSIVEVDQINNYHKIDHRLTEIECRDPFQLARGI